MWSACVILTVNFDFTIEIKLNVYHYMVFIDMMIYLKYWYWKNRQTIPFIYMLLDDVIVFFFSISQTPYQVTLIPLFLSLFSSLFSISQFIFISHLILFLLGIWHSYIKCGTFDCCCRHCYYCYCCVYAVLNPMLKTRAFSTFVFFDCCVIGIVSLCV